MHMHMHMHMYMCMCMLHILLRAIARYEVLSLLLAPIKDSESRVVGLVELVNKVELDGGAVPKPAPKVAAAQAAAASSLSVGGGSGGGGGGGGKRLKRRNSVNGFTEDDVRLLRMLCTHCSIYLRHLDTHTGD